MKYKILNWLFIAVRKLRIKLSAFESYLYDIREEHPSLSIEDFNKNKNPCRKLQRKRKFCVISQVFTPALLYETTRKTVNTL